MVIYADRCFVIHPPRVWMLVVVRCRTCLYSKVVIVL